MLSLVELVKSNERHCAFPLALIVENQQVFATNRINANFESSPMSTDANDNTLFVSKQNLFYSL